MAGAFELHPQLAADTAEVSRWPLCRVLLMDDANYPWLVLVPALPDLRDLHDLPADRQGEAMKEIGRASSALQSLFDAAKINVAALGNQVPQLHIHVIARRHDDPAWPKPVWGVVPARPHDPEVKRGRLADLRRAFGGAG